MEKKIIITETQYNKLKHFLIKENEVEVTPTDSNNPSFEKGTMITFSVDGGILEIGKVNFSKSKYYSILRLYVDENKRRTGIAEKLLKSALDYTNNNLHGMASNDAAVSLNYKLGMRIKGGEDLSLTDTINKREEDKSLPMVGT
jgi:GNAT superfamily N-acetyltransferase